MRRKEQVCLLNNAWFKYFFLQGWLYDTIVMLKLSWSEKFNPQNQFELFRVKKNMVRI
jgi:hypothetical protein